MQNQIFQNEFLKMSFKNELNFSKVKIFQKPEIETGTESKKSETDQDLAASGNPIRLAHLKNLKNKTAKVNLCSCAGKRIRETKTD